MKELILFLLFFGAAVPAWAISKFAIAAGGNWTANGTWSTTSGGANDTTAPTAADDVFLDANSGNVTINAASVARSLNCTGYTHTLTHTAGITLSLGNGTAGAGNVALELVPGMTYTLGSTSTSAISFVSTSATQQTIDYGGLTAANITFNGVGGDWAMITGVTTTTAATVTITNGTLETDGTTDNAGLSHSWGNFTGNAGTLTLGTSSLNVTNATNNVVWNMSGTTLTANTSTITMSGAGTHTWNSGGKTTYNSLVFAAGHSPLLNSSFTCVNLTKNTSGAGETIGVIANASTPTITGSLALNGTSASQRLLVNSQTLGNQRTWTITGATVTGQYVDFEDTKFSVATDLSGITGGSGDAGGNNNITFTTSTEQFWFKDTGNWSDSTKWFQASNGGGGAGRVPLPQDDVQFDVNSFSAGGQTVTEDVLRIGRSVSWAGVGHAPTWGIGTTAFTLYGSLTLTSGVTLGGSNKSITFEGRNSYTMTNAGRGWFANGDANVNVQMIGGTLTLQDSLVLNSGAGGSRTVNIVAGTFDANNFSVTGDIIQSTGSLTRAIKMGTGTWTGARTSATPWNFAASGLTLTPATSLISISNTGAGSKTFAGAGLTYYDLSLPAGGAGAIIFTGANTFHNFTINGAKTVTLSSSTTTTVSQFIGKGSSGNVVTLNSSTGGTAATLSQSSGVNYCNYCTIQDSTATGGAAWRAFNSTSTSGNTGWKFAHRIL